MRSSATADRRCRASSTASKHVVPDAGNRRSGVVSLTRSGRTLSACVYDALRDFEETALRNCPATDLAAFARVIERLRRPDGLLK